MWVCYVKKEFTKVMHTACACQRNVNYARWNVILIVALKDDKQEWRKGCFAADLTVNVLFTTIAGLVSSKPTYCVLFNYNL